MNADALPEILGRLGIALGLGLLVGLQRERTDSRLAGFRTFPLIALLGGICGLLAEAHGGWIIAGGLAALALVIIGGDLPLLRAGQERPGVTTEVTMLVMYVLGAYLIEGSAAVAIASCGAVVVLLHLKPQLHSLAARIGDRDFTAVVQFALISLVILPVLPDRAYGPYAVLNPFKLWLMVVLIVGLSLGGYIAYKLVGSRAGAWANGVLGGLISSTATTVSVARQSRSLASAADSAAFVILMASAIVFVRVGVLLAAAAPGLLRSAFPPLFILFGVLATFAWMYLRGEDGATSSLADHGNPSELKPALLFGLLFTAVLLAVAAANAYFGPRGLYVTAVISGLTDMDAITLSVAQLVEEETLRPEIGWRVIIVAALSNLAFKTGVVAFLGGRPLLRRVALGFGVATAVGLGLLRLLPA